MKRTKTILAIALAAILVCVGAVAVFAKPVTPAYQTGKFDSANEYVEDQVTILTRAVTDAGTFTTIKTASQHFLKIDGGKDYNYFGILVCEPAANGYYKVISTNFALSRDVVDGKTPGIKYDVEIPEDGFILGIQGKKTELFEAVKNAVVIGDLVKISGVEVSNLELEDAKIATLTGATWELYHDDGTTEEPVEESKDDSSAAASSKTETPDTGDTTVLFVVVAVVALAGVAVAKKVRG